MKLSIIPSDGTVCENGSCYTGLTFSGIPADVHALQWQDVKGWIEFNDGKTNEDISSLPEWSSNAIMAWTVANTPVPPSPPTAEENKATAVGLLQATDWTTIADVGNPQMSNPYLANQADFIAYRNTVRTIAVYPTAGDIDFPATPNSNWVKV